MLAIKPAGLDGGDEELGAVTIEGLLAGDELLWVLRRGLRVGTSVGHGEKTRALVADLEVLVGELLTVDGLSTGTLDKH